MANSADQSLAYHAARLLILIRECGRPRSDEAVLPAIEGRTLLAKLDFFLRYPAYLHRAAVILRKPLRERDLGVSGGIEADTVESHMVRYLYGPWDHVYYPTLAYLIGKQLITVDMTGGVERFRLTPQGANVAARLAAQDAFHPITDRASAIWRLFGSYKGNRLRQFIYDNFPDVVGRKLGEKI